MVATWQNRTCAPTANQRQVFAEKGRRNVSPPSDLLRFDMAARITLAHFLGFSAIELAEVGGRALKCRGPRSASGPMTLDRETRIDLFVESIGRSPAGCSWARRRHHALASKPGRNSAHRSGHSQRSERWVGYRQRSQLVWTGYVQSRQAGCPKCGLHLSSKQISKIETSHDMVRAVCERLPSLEQLAGQMTKSAGAIRSKAELPGLA